jgi:hypothetical protein
VCPDGEVGGEASPEPLEGDLQLGRGSIRARQQVARDGPDSLEQPQVLRARGIQDPRHGREQREQHQDPDQGQVDLKVEPAHQSPASSS